MKILILVLSCNDGIYKELDTAIKNTWGKNTPNNVEILYYYGYCHDKPIPVQGRAIINDKDIICGYVENVSNIGRKTVCTFEYVFQNYEFDYIFRCCSGSYIDIDKMLKVIEDKPKKKYYGGIFQRSGRYFIGGSFVSGAGYFLSRDLVQYVVANKNKWDYRLPDDISLNVILSDAGISKTEIRSRVDISGQYHLDGKGFEDKDFFHYHFCQHPECMYVIARVNGMKVSKDNNTCNVIDTTVGQLCSRYIKAKSAREGVDIRDHLPTLYKYASQCKTVTEFGVGNGISSWAFLMGLPARYTSYDINDFLEKDLFKRFSDILGVNYSFSKADVLNIEIEPTDLLFIDTLHTYDQLFSELYLHAKNVSKYIIFHDTVTFGYVNEPKTSIKNGSGKTGLLAAINDVLLPSGEWEIKERFDNCNGLLVVERKNR